eukprot:1781962-Alexandrium_andersonii.AAC.1
MNSLFRGGGGSAATANRRQATLDQNALLHEIRSQLLDLRRDQEDLRRRAFLASPPLPGKQGKGDHTSTRGRQPAAKALPRAEEAAPPQALSKKAKRRQRAADKAAAQNVWDAAAKVIERARHTGRAGGELLSSLAN